MWWKQHKWAVLLPILALVLLAGAFWMGGSAPGLSGWKIDSAEQDAHQTDPVPEGKPLPVEPQDAVLGDEEYTCTFSISCAAILEHPEWLNPEKAELVPEDGWVLAPTSVPFSQGESVFDVLLQVCRDHQIHLEFENPPGYNSAYIEGIHNLYEFDCGQQSGWMYFVNGWNPNYGSSRYQLQNGDTVEWAYTCALGDDLGAGAAGE